MPDRGCLAAFCASSDDWTRTLSLSMAFHPHDHAICPGPYPWSAIVFQQLSEMPSRSGLVSCLGLLRLQPADGSGPFVSGSALEVWGGLTPRDPLHCLYAFSCRGNLPAIVRSFFLRASSRAHAPRLRMGDVLSWYEAVEEYHGVARLVFSLAVVHCPSSPLPFLSLISLALIGVLSL